MWDVALLWGFSLVVLGLLFWIWGVVKDRRVRHEIRRATPRTGVDPGLPANTELMRRPVRNTETVRLPVAR
jgi:hypothetical protein